MCVVMMEEQKKGMNDRRYKDSNLGLVGAGQQKRKPVKTTRETGINHLTKAEPASYPDKISLDFLHGSIQNVLIYIQYAVVSVFVVGLMRAFATSHIHLLSLLALTSHICAE